MVCMRTNIQIQQNTTTMHATQTTWKPSHSFLTIFKKTLLRFTLEGRKGRKTSTYKMKTFAGKLLEKERLCL